MSLNITKYRRAISDVLGETGHDVRVQLAPLDYNNPGGSFGGGVEELKFTARVVVGEPTEAADAVVDELVDKVPDLIAADRQLGGACSDADVTYCSGHRLYASGPNEPPLAGAEWTVKVVI
jgi:hypothetical protein